MTTSVSNYTTVSRGLANLQSIQYIRASQVVISVSGSRPNTLLHTFFDGINVDQYCGPVAMIAGTTVGSVIPAVVPVGIPVVTDVYGNATVLFNIPGITFNTGNKTVIVTEVTDISLLSVPGTSYGSATATYTTRGTLERYQTISTKVITTTTVNTVKYPYQPPPPPPPPRVIVGRCDPLAESFFTYGVNGGIFLTAIELFFLSKDDSIPIRVELRGMNAGLPMELDQSNADLISSLNPSQITTNTVIQVKAGNSVGTKFRFNPPVYLKSDSDYCFVVFSNSNKYNVFTSKLGETSFETGKQILDQPYVGSLFKSENNYTWTPEQTEDIKFNLYQANFGAGSATPTFTAQQIPYSISGNNFYTTAGSSLVVYKSPMIHALEVGDYVTIGSSSIGIYNGIPGANLTGDFAVVSVVDDRTLTFNAGATATSTGPITTCGFLRNINITNGGAGYTSPPTIVVTGSATATCTVLNGAIATVTITPGAGYTIAPTLTVSGTGSGAVLTPSIAAQFSVITNTAYSIITPQLQTGTPPNTSIAVSTNTMYGNYNGGSLASYTFGPATYMNLNDIVEFPQYRRMASRANEVLRINPNRSLTLGVTMSTSNPNLSPVIDLRITPKLSLSSYRLNNQNNNEYVVPYALSTDPVIPQSGSIATITNLIGGSGYGSTPPTVSVINASNDITGTGAILTAVLTSGIVTSITINSPGTGYTQIPSIVLTAPTSGVTATASCTLTQFNTELGGVGNPIGTAYSRYLSKRVTLAAVSTGVRVISVIDSAPTTNVDVYIRTSFSGNNVNHLDQSWILLTGDAPRNKSGTKGQFFSYTFTNKLGIAPFDVYDLKFVLSSSNPARTPYIQSYRTIVTA